MCRFRLPSNHGEEAYLALKDSYIDGTNIKPRTSEVVPFVVLQCH